jgi:predicted ester cyclase
LGVPGRRQTTKLLVARLVLAAAGLVFLVFAGCARNNNPQREKDSVEAHLKTFDELDFEVFSNQQWDRLSESHAHDIVVTWPDGHQTKGIEKHIEDLKAMFVYAPDTKIKEHPIKFGSGEWTAVTGVMTGTFSRPMPTPDGKAIPPTGKSFKLPMATIARWKDGKMIEESLFWDNQAFMKQIGLAK